jgi:hypothetical protein
MVFFDNMQILACNSFSFVFLLSKAAGCNCKQKVMTRDYGDDIVNGVNKISFRAVLTPGSGIRDGYLKIKIRIRDEYFGSYSENLETNFL